MIERERVLVGCADDPAFAKLVNANREALDQAGIAIRTSRHGVHGKAFIDGGPSKRRGIINLDEGVAVLL